ncbi:MAG: tyrosine-type recombinase/integrase [Brachymonas sp.]|nr:tyrosine-type recombinase/integrase [Brachymonas sp.]
MALTDTAAKNTRHSGKPAGDKLYDTGGLYLLVKAAGRYWRMDYRFAGKRKTLALGIYPAVSLAQARKGRDKARDLLAQGIDPSLHRRAEKLTAMAAHENSFEAVAARWHAQWKEGKASTTAQTKWMRLQRDVFPSIGRLPIDEVTPAMLVMIVKAINARGARDTAERVLNSCNQIFRYAIGHCMAQRNPAAEIRPADILPAHKVKNHARVSEAQLPDLLRAIYAYEGRGEWQTSYALQLLCLTFVRTSELLQTPWSEIDFGKALWVIPAERMKMPRPHVVPLSRQALEAFRKLKAINGQHEHVFHSARSRTRHMSNGTMLQALYRMGYKGIMTGHGFRGIASTVMHENGFAKAHIEAQLSHKDKDKVAAAYNHAQYIKQRTDLMQWWGDYVENCTQPNVLTLPRRA